MINQSNIFKKIGHILNELQDQYEFLSENPEQLSELELELFLANANFLSDHVEIVRKLNNNKPVKQLQQSTDQEVFEGEQSALEVQQPKVEAKTSMEEAIHSKDITSISDSVSEPEGGLLIEEIEREELHQDDLPPTFEFIIDKNSATGKLDFEEEEEVAETIDKTLEEEESIVGTKMEFSDHSSDVVTNDDDMVEQDAEPSLIKSEQSVPVQPAADSYQAPINPEVKKVPQPQQELRLDKVEEKQVPVASSNLVVDKVEEKVVPQTSFNTQQENIQPNPLQRPTLNDLLAGNNGSAKSEESTRPTITDLKRAITLNEKLLYIKDLFNGYNLAYSEAIDLINKMPDLKTADAFLKSNYAVKNNWEAKQTTVSQFYELLKQRFPAG